MMLNVLAWCSLFFAAIPAWMFARNFWTFRRLPKFETASLSSDSTSEPTLDVSVLIPARNEQDSIVACVQSAIGNRRVNVEVVVLDDHSDDKTAARVRELADADSRIRLEQARTLPPGWCGKQHACAQLAELARHDLFVFLDADVRLSGDALYRIARHYDDLNVGLLSGFPRQRTGTLAEHMLIPLMHFVLLGFLSLRRMRSSVHPAFGAGCGQLFVTRRGAYERSGGHAGIRTSLHDGLKLPRLYRSKGLSTDLFDATDISTCRMYESARDVWHGLKKNATEGVASPGLIVPVTLMLFCGQVMPFALLLFTWWQRPSLNSATFAQTLFVLTIACLLALLPRLISSVRYRQSMLGAALHPLAIVAFLVIQWAAFLSSFSKRAVSWKGRPYPAS